MPTENINIETQVQSAITRAALQALVTASTVKKKIYHITDALAGTATIAVYSRSTNQVSYNAMNLNTGKFGMYWLAFDVFNPIVEGDTAVMSYVNNTFFPPTGNYNAVYLDLSTGIAYAWNGTTYFALSGGNVYEPTLGDFPLTGATDTIYVATDTGVMYLWDGSAYVPLNNQSVQTVSGYSVDNTDPVNPIVKAIPTAGTNAAEPVTGDIEMSALTRLYDVFGDLTREVIWDDEGGLKIRVTDSVTGNDTFVAVFGSQVQIQSTYGTSGFLYNIAVSNNGIGIYSSDPDFQGQVYNADYSANFILESLISQRVMKSRIWTKAGTWDADDDSTKGFIQGSLLWDTTNSILYRCTDSTATAAVWVKAIKTTLLDSIRPGGGVPASSTRWATEGLTGPSASLVVTIAPRAIYTTFKVFLSSAQPAGGSLTITRDFYNMAGVLTDTQTLVIPAGSVAGMYEYTGASLDLSSVDRSYSFKMVNAAAATSGAVNSIESVYTI